jgi:hypothetical protein
MFQQAAFFAASGALRQVGGDLPGLIGRQHSVGVVNQ